MLIPSLRTIYTMAECRPAEGFLKREQYVGDFLHSTRQHEIDSEIISIAEFDCEFDIPDYNHHVHKIDANTYQIHIWNDGIKFPTPQPDRIIDVRIDHVLEFMGRHFKLGEEVEVD